MKKIKCSDVSEKGCDFVSEGENEMEVLMNMAVHGKENHDLKDEDMTPELIDKAKAAMTDA